MKRVAVPDLRPGFLVARDLLDGKGGILLRRGVELNWSHIHALEERGFAWVYVSDEASDRIVVEDMVASYLDASAEPVLHSVASLGAAKGDKGDARTDWTQECERVSCLISQVLSAEVLTALARMAAADSTLLFHGLHTAMAGLWLGMRMVLDDSAMRSLAVGCMLHDCGKAQLSHHLFLLPTLSREQLEELERHPLLGLHTARDLGVDDPDVAAAIGQHHERQDGKGYPRGRRGTNRVTSGHPTGRIALAAEVTAVADAFAILTSDTLATMSLEPLQVARMLRQLSGTVLNKQLVDHLVEGRSHVPVGLQVYASSGRYAGCRGTVVRVSPTDSRHVVARLVQDNGGGWMQPLELDTAEDDETCVLGQLS